MDKTQEESRRGRTIRSKIREVRPYNAKGALSWIAAVKKGF